MADRLDTVAPKQYLPAHQLSGRLVDLKQEGKAIVLTVTGRIADQLVLRPVRFDGEQRWLLYRRAETR